jgi:hypothetical protein
MEAGASKKGAGRVIRENSEMKFLKGGGGTHRRDVEELWCLVGSRERVGEEGRCVGGGD